MKRKNVIALIVIVGLPLLLIMFTDTCSTEFTTDMVPVPEGNPYLDTIR